MAPEPHGSTQPPSPGSSQPDASRQMSATIQRSANDFVVLIENEKAKAREAAERQLAAAEQRNVQFRQQASAAMGAALNRARNAEEQARIAVATMQAKETEVGSMKEQISQLRE
ncbi:hypothetical protein DAEQUDRAFT_732473 [Daedalea quercina L-15889]|uniref:Uncharacterized protein n=1 Tax=Daedalea quercina L-15889 TaxID=1314783 RepID=A0A165LKH4_9APHY|nr:hypothetical protein DAEQUDRAFT_732473 [Daedalea quercina L-15889]